MLDTWRKLMDILDRRERRRFWLLMAMVLAMGFANMIGVASVIPFLAVLADPTLIDSNAVLASLYAAGGFADAQSFTMALGIAVFVLYSVGLAVKAGSTYALIRFGTMRSYSMASRLLGGYLARPYVWFLDRHSADLTRSLLNEVGQVVNGALVPLLNVIANVVLTVFMVGLLVLIDPLIALASAVVLGGGYGLVFAMVRNRQGRLGEEQRLANMARFRAAQETLTGIKEIKVLGLERSALERFRAPALRVARAGAASGVLSDLPRHLLEAIAFGGMLAVVLTLLALEGGALGAVLPIAGVYALAGSRISPALQMIYRNLATMRFNQAVLARLHADLTAAPEAPPEVPAAATGLRERVILDDVHFAYPKAERAALHGLSLEIPAGASIGIVGGTGAGKTTAVDLLLGLLEPQAGRLTVDGRPIVDEAGRRAWRRSIGYVPQQIFLVDASVAENIAFGLPPEAVDMAAVERAARLAALHDFVMADLPQGYATLVGDRGVRLSGGQRQRIGIARALYHDPDLLVLDEATSALDNLTEREVMQAVAGLGGIKTVVMIAHRLTTVMGCDEIFLLEGGQVAARGAYAQLVETNAVFRAMAGGEAA